MPMPPCICTASCPTWRPDLPICALAADTARARAAGRQVDESALLNCSDESAPDPAESTISLEQRHLVQMCVAQLGDPCRKLVSMLYLQQPSPHYDEVAEELGMSRGSIGPLRSRCLKRLAEIVERMRLE